MGEYIVEFSYSGSVRVQAGDTREAERIVEDMPRKTLIRHLQREVEVKDARKKGERRSGRWWWWSDNS